MGIAEIPAVIGHSPKAKCSGGFESEARKIHPKAASLFSTTSMTGAGFDQGLKAQSLRGFRGPWHRPTRLPDVRADGIAVTEKTADGKGCVINTSFLVVDSRSKTIPTSGGGQADSMTSSRRSWLLALD